MKSEVVRGHYHQDNQTIIFKDQMSGQASYLDCMSLDYEMDMQTLHRKVPDFFTVEKTWGPFVR